MRKLRLRLGPSEAHSLLPALRSASSLALWSVPSALCPGALEAGPGPRRTDFHGSNPKRPTDPRKPPASQACANLDRHARRLGRGRQGCPKSPDPRCRDPQACDWLSTDSSSNSSPKLCHHERLRPNNGHAGAIRGHLGRLQTWLHGTRHQVTQTGSLALVLLAAS